MSFPEGDSRLRRRWLCGWPVWSYWLAWTVVVVVDAASYRQAEYQFWLLSPYAWWIAPFVLWWTIPRDTPVHVSIVWPLFILTWAAWRFLSLEYESIGLWSVIADDSTFKLLQLPLKAVVAGAVLAIAFSRPVGWIAGGFAGRAAFVVGVAATAMTYRDHLQDLDRWQFEPVVNVVLVFNVLLIALLLAVSIHWVRPTPRFTLARQKASMAGTAIAPRIAGFPGIFLIAALLMFGAVLKSEPLDNTWLKRNGIAVGAGMLPIVFVTLAGIRAWRRLGAAVHGHSICNRLSAIAGRVGVVLAAGLLWLELIWLAAPVTGSEMVEAFRSLSGPRWSVRANAKARTIVLSGELESGVAAAVRSTLNSNQQTKFLQLSSPGGLVSEAETIAVVVQSRGLITVVSAECESACTTILASGAERWLIEGGAIGLHSASALGLPVEYEDADNSGSLSSLIAHALLARREATVPYWDMWYPLEKELLESGLVTRVMTVEEYQRAVVDYTR